MERSREREVSIARSVRSVKATIQRGVHEYALGLFLLLVVVLLWTLSNYVTQELFKQGFNRPFLMTYLNTSSFSLYLISFGWRYMRERRGQGLPPRLSRFARRASGQYQALSPEEERGLIEDNYAVASSPSSDAPLTTGETSRLALEFCFLWFLANWSVNASLAYTSVASVTILSSMSGFFTLALGRLAGVEALNTAKVVAVAISFTGVILVSLSDSNTAISTADPINESPALSAIRVWGDLFALLSAVFYALYVILLKVRIKNEERVDMQLFFGFVGLYNVLLCWPVIILFHLMGVETFGLPETKSQAALVGINMIITLTSDYIYVLAMLKTTPLVVTIGLSLTIPLAVFGDALLGHPAATQVLLGAVLVFFSFVVVGVHGADEEGRASLE